jgi:DNA recombination protein RmuC
MILHHNGTASSALSMTAGRRTFSTRRVRTPRDTISRRREEPRRGAEEWVRHGGRHTVVQSGTDMEALLMLFAGVLAGAVAAWLYFRSDRAVLTERLEARAQQIAQMENQLRENQSWIAALERQGAELKVREAELKTALELERTATQEKLAVVEQSRKALEDAFGALSAEALKSNNQAFLDLAKETLEKHQLTAKAELESREQAVAQLVKPIGESLAKVDRQIQELEKTRAGAYSGLSEQVKFLSEAQSRLQAETANLVKALRQPQTRGRWGELQLQRVVELAGMREHVDFEQQVTTDAGRQRPDMTVFLPNGQCVIVDSKAPLEAYLQALEAPDEPTRCLKLKDHARQVRSHIDALADKTYWQSFPATPEFVVLFVPGEAFFSAALEQDPALIEYGIDRKVVMATPTTLIALLKAVAYGWKQQKLAENAQKICDLGRELYERLAILGAHFDDLRRALDRAVGAYNSAVGSLESRVLVSARKFRELEAGSEEEIAVAEQIDHTARQLQAPELAPTT